MIIISPTVSTIYIKYYRWSTYIYIYIYIYSVTFSHKISLFFITYAKIMPPAVVYQRVGFHLAKWTLEGNLQHLLFINRFPKKWWDLLDHHKWILIDKWGYVYQKMKCVCGHTHKHLHFCVQADVCHKWHV